MEGDFMEKRLTVVVSVYNEEAVLKKFYQEAINILGTISWEWELIFVNDGSEDSSEQILDQFASSDKRVKVINFSRNWGHEAAMIAGIDHSRGNGIICMDADLQHPLECIPQIINRFEAGYNVINMVRTSNKSAGLIKNITSSAFYKVINVLSEVKFTSNASDFFAIDRKAAHVLKHNYREKVRFLRGYVQDIGFNKTSITYDARDRAAGESKYSIRKLFKFSINTIMCFSDLPLKLGVVSGIIVAMSGILLLIYTLFTRQGAPSGYTTIVVALCFMFALLFIVVGIIGQYIAILFVELKDRPLYLINTTKNMEESTYEDNNTL